MSTAATYEIYYWEAAAGTEWESESRAESHFEKKISWPFQILREVKKSAKTQNQRKKMRRKKEQKCTHTHTHKCWAPHPVGVEASAVESAQTPLPAPGKDGRRRVNWRGGRGLKCPENNTSCREAGGGSEPSFSSWRIRNLTKQSASSEPAHPTGILFAYGTEGTSVDELFI